ncbi:MAG: cyclase family protein [Pyrinomonadaceae bacterium]|nr:cyclase family protein [Pyrinomonadaceae bacterium]
MEIYDITVAISESVPIYEGDPKVNIEAVMTMQDGSAANVSHVCFGAHTGTHVDAPNHFIDGTRRVDELDLDKLIGTCHVHQVGESVVAIGPEHLPGLDGIERLLLKTRNSAFWSTPEEGFRTDFTYLTLDAAKMIAHAGIKLIGIDYLSIEEPGAGGHPVHITLLEKEIVILEGVDLRQIPEGDYELICLPLKYRGGTGDGAPARTVLVRK